MPRPWDFLRIPISYEYIGDEVVHRLGHPFIFLQKYGFGRDRACITWDTCFLGGASQARGTFFPSGDLARVDGVDQLQEAGRDNTNSTNGVGGATSFF